MVRDLLGMKSHNLLSGKQYEYLTSQKSITNPSEQKKRISMTVEQSFNTFDIILTSQHIPQEFKDKLFEETKVKNFLKNFTRYDKLNLQSEESNKQSICKTMVTIGLDYFKSRYKKMQMVEKNIEQATNLLHFINSISQDEIHDEEVLKMYKARSRSVRPQLLVAEKDFWVVECKHCYNFSSNAKTEKEAIRNLKHTKYCLYTIDMKKFGVTQKDSIIQRYIIKYPPRDKT